MDTMAILLVILLHTVYTCAKEIEPITIGTLVPRNNARLFSIDRVEPAIEIAVEKVRTELKLITDRNISIHFADSKCNVADGMNEAINFFVRREIDVFFGPCCDYAAAPVARQIRYWNIAMVTPGAMARDFATKKKSMFNLTTRVGSNINSIVNMLLSLLQKFSWHKVNLLYDPEGQNHILEKFCHITADGIHFGLKDAKLEQRYFKFETIDMILSTIVENIGKEYASKCSFI
jgi:ABC-type branched-subunit amino acid transport system substrate-binding protein